MSIDTVDAGIIVKAADRAKWLRHIERADAAELTVTMGGFEYDSAWPAEKITAKVSSETDHAKKYAVTMTRWVSPVDGTTVLVECSCKAGQAEKFCKHAAIALRVSNFYPFSVRIPSPNPELDKLGKNMLLNPKWRK